jgi:hypothetical protein
MKPRPSSSLLQQAHVEAVRVLNGETKFSDKALLFNVRTCGVEVKMPCQGCTCAYHRIAAYAWR